MDGSGTWFLASGRLLNNTFTGDLVEYSGGKALGMEFKAASNTGASPGIVIINFSSGLAGTITFPGETAQRISKFEFGYGKDSQGLLGSYLFAYTSSSTGVTFTDTYKLTSIIGQATTNGSGIVTNTSGTFACENQVTGTLAGSVLCAETGSTGYEDQYVFKISADRGTGVGKWVNTNSNYPLQVIRTATKTGKLTGVNDGTLESLAQSNGNKMTAASQHYSSDQQRFDLNNLKDRESQLVETGFGLTPQEMQAATQVVIELRAKLLQ